MRESNNKRIIFTARLLFSEFKLHRIVYAKSLFSGTSTDRSVLKKNHFKILDQQTFPQTNNYLAHNLPGLLSNDCIL